MNDMQPQAIRCRMLPCQTGVRRGAFTLVEMLVTLTIGSLLVVSAVSATRALAGSREALNRRVERQATARRAMETIVAALRNIRRDPIGQEPALVGKRGGSDLDGDRIDLLILDSRRCRPDGAESDQYEMSFFLTQRPETELPALMCRKDHAFDDKPYDGGLVTVVAEGIVALSFEYLSGQQWMPDWPETEQRPPDAVRVTVAATNTDAGGEGPALADRQLQVTQLSTVVALGKSRPPTQRPGMTPEQGAPAEAQP